MKEKNKQIYMPNRIIDIILIALPILGVLIKQLLYLGFIFGDNYYEINLTSAFNQGGIYCFLQLAVIGLLLVPAIFCKNKGKYWYLLAINAFFTILALVDIWYVRFFNDLPSISMLSIVSFTNDSVASSGNALLPVLWKDLIFAIDLVVWLAIFLTAYLLDKKKSKSALTNAKYNVKKRGIAFSALACAMSIMLICLPVLSCFNVGNSLMNDSFSTHSARSKSVAFTPVGYHLYDIVDSIIPKSISDADQKLIDGYYEWNKADYSTDSEYYAKFSGKNVVVLQLESFETFLIGNEIEGQEITPNLNSLLSKSYFFDNIYDQVACGNSSDCDFMINTSLLPSSGVSAYNFFSDNEYNSTPMILSCEGYTTSYFNSLKNSFWNYYPMNKDGMKFDINDYEFDKSDTIYQYISDESYLNQLADKITALQEEYDGPLYSHTTTDSSHGPFSLPDDCCTLTLSDKYDNALGDYLQAVHYTDACLGEFLEKMKSSPEYNDTVFVFVGDHRGIHKYYPQVINEIDELPSFIKYNYDAGVPLIIYDPSMADGEGKTISTYGGQIDVAPTIFYLLGVDYDLYKDTCMGRNLLNTSRNCTYSSDGIMRGNPTETDEYYLKNAYYISDLMLETDYFNKK